MPFLGAFCWPAWRVVIWGHWGKELCIWMVLSRPLLSAPSVPGHAGRGAHRLRVRLRQPRPVSSEVTFNKSIWLPACAPISLCSWATFLFLGPWAFSEPHVPTGATSAVHRLRAWYPVLHHLKVFLSVSLWECWGRSWKPNVDSPLKQ